MISIYTHTHAVYTKEFWKRFVRNISGKYSGPDAVRDSLLRALRTRNIPFELNARKPKYRHILILSGVHTLQEQLNHKKAGDIIIAGPNIAEMPHDHHKILCDERIDIIVTPSNWVRDLYTHLAPQLKNKIHVWPAGVEIPPKHSRGQDILILQKHADSAVLEYITQTLTQQNIAHTIMYYGKFTHTQYINQLHNSKILIYLQTTESQGLLLQEAWAHNVPTLVYRHTAWARDQIIWKDPNISAPYLHESCGAFFELNNFYDTFIEIMRLTLEPRDYCNANLSDDASLSKLLTIINTYEKKD